MEAIGSSTSVSAMQTRLARQVDGGDGGVETAAAISMLSKSMEAEKMVVAMLLPAANALVDIKA